MGVPITVGGQSITVNGNAIEIGAPSVTIPLGAAIAQMVVADPLNIPDTFGVGISLATAWPNDEPNGGFLITTGVGDTLASATYWNGAGQFLVSLNNDMGANPNGITINNSLHAGVLAFGGSDLCDNGTPNLHCLFAVAPAAATYFNVTNPHEVGDNDTTSASIGPYNGGFGGLIFTGDDAGVFRYYLIDYTNETISQAFQGPPNTFPLIWWETGGSVMVLNKQAGVLNLTTFTPTALGTAWVFNSVLVEYDNPTITALVVNNFMLWIDGDSFVAACEYDALGNPMPNPIVVSTKMDLSSYDTNTLSAGDPATVSVFDGFLASGYDLDFAWSQTDRKIYMAAGPTSGGRIFSAIVGAAPLPPYIPPPALYRLPCYQVCQPLYIGRI